MNIFAIFFDFSVTSCVGTKRNDNIHFLSFSAFSNLFSSFLILLQPIVASIGAIMVFFKFLEYFCYFFGIFWYELSRNETERQYLFSFFLGLFQPTLPLNEAILLFFNFLNFFAIFLEFSIIHQVGTERNYNFYFISFSLSFNWFWIEIKP